MKNKFTIESKVKTRIINKPIISINLFKPPYVEKVESTHEQTYIEVSFEFNDKSVTIEEKEYVMNLFLEKLRQECNLHTREN